MYLNNAGNVFAVCTVVSTPEYKEEVGEKRLELTKAYAKCTEMTPDGKQNVGVNLMFFSALALPAMKIAPGMKLLVAGCQETEERYVYGRNRLEHTLYVEWWSARVIDPLGLEAELRTRREIDSKVNDLRLLFAQFLTECKPTIGNWVKAWVMEIIEQIKATKTKKKEGNASDKNGNRESKTGPEDGNA